MNIPFIDLKQQYLTIKEEVNDSILKVLQHGQYVLGPEIRDLESELAQFIQVQHVLTCSSGTDALLLALMAYDVGPGDAVFTTPFTFIATAEVISLLGATPVFVDIDEKTFNIAPQLLEEKIATLPENLNAKAIIAVDLFGLCADYDELTSVANKHNLILVEDAAQSLGAVYKGKKAGAFGHVAATSFYPAKPLGAYGDGGAVFTNDTSIHEKMESIRVHGQGKNKYDNVRLGLNARMDTIQAAVLLHKLQIFPREIEQRQQIANLYTQSLNEYVTTPFIPDDCTSTWAQYSILSDKREVIQKHLKEQGIPTCIFYAKPLHMQDAFKSLGYKQGDFPISENAAQKIMSLPMHPYLKPQDQQHIIAQIIAAVNK
ncbi:DegT/DnrJ/EryC1/StrS family aminotransferase [Candidatus Uabimicrobium amorphum]|uniref:Aminotransferase DegT n=1 Tax=Uabimicrobium amorphum TaxID=2596890 RepID=A0A5S9F3E7_UABAM|nr:DegT/DnrJ/EryC1/StrS family aminotransferase [Candidatus Uabimicrobium amorphum]BBM84181.1 aminotransferase DegT [Candidatus Uabimicrobium amorphum]